MLWAERERERERDTEINNKHNTYEHHCSPMPQLLVTNRSTHLSGGGGGASARGPATDTI